MAAWLIVERYKNWLCDKDRAFTLFGVPENRLTVANKVRKNDTLLVYVSDGHSAFSDIRLVQSAGTEKINHALVYKEELYNHAIHTSPILTLPEDRWVNIRELIPNLTFISNKQKWGSALLTSIRQLNDGDAGIIVCALKGAQGTESRSNDK